MAGEVPYSVHLNGDVQESYRHSMMHRSGAPQQTHECNCVCARQNKELPSHSLINFSIIGPYEGTYFILIYIFTESKVQYDGEI